MFKMCMSAILMWLPTMTYCYLLDCFYKKVNSACKHLGVSERLTGIGHLEIQRSRVSEYYILSKFTQQIFLYVSYSPDILNWETLNIYISHELYSQFHLLDICCYKVKSMWLIAMFSTFNFCLFLIGGVLHFFI